MFPIKWKCNIAVFVCGYAEVLAGSEIVVKWDSAYLLLAPDTAHHYHYHHYLPETQSVYEHM